MVSSGFTLFSSDKRLEKIGALLHVSLEENTKNKRKQATDHAKLHDGTFLMDSSKEGITMD